MADLLEGIEPIEGETKAQCLEKLKKAKERLELLGKNKGAVIIPKEKKLAKFDGKGDAKQWLEDLESIITRFTKDQDKVTYILEHLEGPARVEIKFQVDPKKATSEEVLEVLKNVYAKHDTWVQLQQQFYGRDQKPGENLMEYTQTLMELLLELREKSPGGKLKDMDSILKQKVAEGVIDTTLRRELRRLNEEKNDLKFYEFREHAMLWMETGTTSTTLKSTQEVATVGTGSETFSLETLKDMVQQQQQAIETLKGQQQHQHPTTSSSSQPKQEVICNHCGGKNHYRRDCVLWKRENASRGNFRGNFRSYFPRGRPFIPTDRGHPEFTNRGRGNIGRGRSNGRGRGFNQHQSPALGQVRQTGVHQYEDPGYYYGQHFYYEDPYMQNPMEEFEDASAEQLKSSE